MKLRRAHLVFMIFVLLSAGFVTAPGDEAYREYFLTPVSESDGNLNATDLSELPPDQQQLGEQLLKNESIKSTIYKLNPYGITIEVSRSGSKWQTGRAEYKELSQYSPISHENQAYRMGVGGYTTRMNPIPFYILAIVSFSIGSYALSRSGSESTNINF